MEGRARRLLKKGEELKKEIVETMRTGRTKRGEEEVEKLVLEVREMEERAKRIRREDWREAESKIEQTMTEVLLRLLSGKTEGMKEDGLDGEDVGEELMESREEAKGERKEEN